MLRKNLLTLFLVIGLLPAVLITYAQEKASNKSEQQTQVINKDVHECMDKIASDSTMSNMMMQKMMAKKSGNKMEMMQMCKTMMNNPEMHKMMMEMMGNMGGDMMKGGMMKGGMMPDSAKAMNKSEHESHHKKDNN